MAKAKETASAAATASSSDSVKSTSSQEAQDEAARGICYVFYVSVVIYINFQRLRN